jgi:TctA family transporter
VIIDGRKRRNRSKGVSCLVKDNFSQHKPMFVLAISRIPVSNRVFSDDNLEALGTTKAGCICKLLSVAPQEIFI